jgi:hypothetical protein
MTFLGGVATVRDQRIPTTPDDTPAAAKKDGAPLRPSLGTPDRKAIPHQDASHRRLLRLRDLRQDGLAPSRLLGNATLEIEHDGELRLQRRLCGGNACQ